MLLENRRDFIKGLSKLCSKALLVACVLSIGPGVLLTELPSSAVALKYGYTCPTALISMDIREAQVCLPRFGFSWKGDIGGLLVF